ncbi:uncharacterized protein LOC100837783 isoform X1 [Brachypodium distachyon]|uniref:CCT domain-containing protein n=2 Tax=Brachypodium distachyon TaxID=15368 RepID=I1HFQ2_BRADI|nr:uncharacterized protein LOC100837783 isoform X1 [Brachypodium distachyon]KQK04553.1 hypothetical protein BRADI_2g14220v3 [Brachypodium distachyon]|eukprot:XP_003567775.1 uncharacterized protein LOC100837783 isoform X1 [Brachypodium distachyon]
MYADAGFGGFSVYSPPAPGSSCFFSTHPDLSYSCFSSSPAPAPAPAPAAAAAAAAPPLLLPADAPLDAAIFDNLGDMGQPSLISEYDLGAEGDLFKAPEPIIEEPLLSLDPVAAAISMMSGGAAENAMDETIKAAAADMGLSEVLYECEKELMEKSAIEETISELLDVKIPMLQVEQEASAAAGECSLHKSVSSGCLNSADWMNGTAAAANATVRPNFLDFQGLDFEAAFGMRRAFSEGDIQNLGANTPRTGNSGNVQASCERLVTIADLKTEERKQKLSRYRKKKVKRNFGRKIKYACRKALADSQPRVRGRFAKMDDGDMLKPRK